jgi:hypothetical protein
MSILAQGQTFVNVLFRAENVPFKSFFVRKMSLFRAENVPFSSFKSLNLGLQTGRKIREKERKRETACRRTRARARENRQIFSFVSIFQL